MNPLVGESSTRDISTPNILDVVPLFKVSPEDRHQNVRKESFLRRHTLLLGCSAAIAIYVGGLSATEYLPKGERPYFIDQPSTPVIHPQGNDKLFTTTTTTILFEN